MGRTVEQVDLLERSMVAEIYALHHTLTEIQASGTHLCTYGPTFLSMPEEQAAATEEPAADP